MMSLKSTCVSLILNKTTVAFMRFIRYQESLDSSRTEKGYGRVYYFVPEKYVVKSSGWVERGLSAKLDPPISILFLDTTSLAALP